MTHKKRSLLRKDAPDPARSYERAKPEHEAGMGRLDAEEFTPVNTADGNQNIAHNRPHSRQINADDDPNRR